MSAYKKFSEYGTNGCGRASIKGESRIMNPIISGKVFTDPFKIPNNGMRVFPPVQTTALDYEKFSNAYPQSKV